MKQASFFQQGLFMIVALVGLAGMAHGQTAKVDTAKVDANVPRWITNLQTGNSRVRFDTEMEIIKQVKDCTQSARLVAPLIGCLGDASDTVRTDAAIAISGIKVFHPDVDCSSAVQPLIDRMQDTAPKVRTAAANALGNLRDARGVPPLVTALSDKYPGVVYAAVLALGLFLDPATADPLAVLLEHADVNVRTETAIVLGKLGDKRAVKPLIGLLTTASAHRAAELLGNLGDAGAVEPLITYLPKAKAKYIPMVALGKLRDPRAIDPLVKEFGGHDVQHAIRALKAIGDRRAVPALIALLKDRVTATHAPPECLVAVDALKTITGQDFTVWESAKWDAWWQGQKP
ncbi:MAG: HEAT repeat domain-containing protein [Armatimonadota bacterium]